MIPLSLTLGVIAGMKEGSAQDRVISFISVVTTSLPEIATAIILTVDLRARARMAAGQFRHGRRLGLAALVLPVLTLVLYDFGYVARMTRASMAEVMTSQYIRTAILKGLPYRRVILRHALRNALIAPFTVIVLQLNWLLSGVVVVEVFFQYAGFGKLLLDAALFGDIYVDPGGDAGRGASSPCCRRSSRTSATRSSTRASASAEGERADDRRHIAARSPPRRSCCGLAQPRRDRRAAPADVGAADRLRDVRRPLGDAQELSCCCPAIPATLAALRHRGLVVAGIADRRSSALTLVFFWLLVAVSGALPAADRSQQADRAVRDDRRRARTDHCSCSAPTSRAATCCRAMLWGCQRVLGLGRHRDAGRLCRRRDVRAWSPAISAAGGTRRYPSSPTCSCPSR